MQSWENVFTENATSKLSEAESALAYVFFLVKNLFRITLTNISWGSIPTLFTIAVFRHSLKCQSPASPPERTGRLTPDSRNPGQRHEFHTLRHLPEQNPV